MSLNSAISISIYVYFCAHMHQPLVIPRRVVNIISDLRCSALQDEQHTITDVKDAVIVPVRTYERNAQTISVRPPDMGYP